MHITLRCQDGEMVEALVLAASRTRMRVVIPGCDDALEFRLKNHKWCLADGNVAELEAVMSNGKVVAVLLDANTRHAA